MPGQMKEMGSRWLSDGLGWIIMVWISIQFPPSFLGRRPRGRLKKILALSASSSSSFYPFQWSLWLPLLILAQGFSPHFALHQFYGLPSFYKAHHNSHGSSQWGQFQPSRPMMGTTQARAPFWALNHQNYWPGSGQVMHTPVASRGPLWLPKTTSHSKAPNYQFFSTRPAWNNQFELQGSKDKVPSPAQQWSHNLGPVRFQGENNNINAIQLLSEPDKVKEEKGHFHHQFSGNQTIEEGFSQVKAKSERKMRTLIIEGDIATDIEENLFRLGIRWDLYPKKRWQNNTIPYILSKDYGTREATMIESALKTFQFLSCLRFEPYNGTQPDYLYIHQSRTRPGCWSFVGRRGGRQDLSLRPPDSTSCHCLCDVGRTLHEVMHALGFYHEHSRPDRDKFIHIVSNNVKEGKMSNFRKKTFDTTTADFDYDYDSIMHYGPYFFSKSKRSRKVTIEPTKFGAKIGQRVMLSKIDCMKINQQFECFDPKDHWNNQRIQILCGMLGYSFK